MAALMLEWIVLAACRTGEARFATWGEIDPVRKTWTVPAERMKTRQHIDRPDHVVPVTGRMEAILTEASRRHPARQKGEEPSATEFVFASGAGKPLSEMACLMLMRGMTEYEDFKPHGLRSTFRDWAARKKRNSRAN